MGKYTLRKWKKGLILGSFFLFFGHIDGFGGHSGGLGLHPPQAILLKLLCSFKKKLKPGN